MSLILVFLPLYIQLMNQELWLEHHNPDQSIDPSPRIDQNR